MTYSQNTKTMLKAASTYQLSMFENVYGFHAISIFLFKEKDRHKSTHFPDA